MQDISMFDIAIIAITFLLGLKGLFKGFIKEVFGLIGIVGGIFVASRAKEDIGDLIAPILALENKSSIELIGFIAGLIGFWIIMYVMGLVLSKMTSLSGLGIFDRIFGFIFGAGKVFLIFSVIIAIASQIKIFKDKVEPNIKNTYSYPLMLEVGGYILNQDYSNITKEATKAVDKAVDASKKIVSETTKEMIQQKAKEAVESVKKTVNESIDTTQETVTQEAKEEIVEVESVVDTQIKDVIEEIK